MKARLFSILVILALGLTGISFKPASAQAYTTSFTTSITYQNVGTAATTTLQIIFYASPTDTTGVTIDRPSLAAGAGTSVFIGSLSEINPGFQGSAVMQADQPLLATLVQVPAAGSPVKVRPLSNGFSAGAPQSLIATVLKGAFGNNTIFSVQNVDTEANNIEIKFYDTSAVLQYDCDSTKAPCNTPLQAGASLYWNVGAAGDPLPPNFNGSAVVIAKRADNSDGAIVSTALELEITTNGGKAFQGVATGAKTFYMPSALCNYNIGGKPTNSSYAIQNTDLANSTDVTVTYSNGASQTQTVGPGAKKSFIGCQAGAPMADGFIGSATVTSTATDVVAIGKVYGSGLSTAFEGVPAGGGSAKVALPYVRFANDTNWASGAQQRVYITIQNIGAAAISGDVVVTYLDCNGGTAGTDTISGGVAVGAKVNSNASKAGLTDFGLCNGGPNFGASAMITAPAGSELAVVARVQTLDPSTGLVVGEDYDGLNVP